MREAQRTAPSIIYIPHIHLWWEAVGTPLKATFTSLMQNIPTFAPVLLLATSDVCHADLPKEVFLQNNAEGICLKCFLSKGIDLDPAFSPFSHAPWRPLEVLPVAPPPKPRQLTEEEIRQLEEQEEDTLRELRIFLRDVTHRLAVDRHFRAFTKPVDPEEVPDYDTVIKQPMDLSAVLSKIDLHQYLTAGDFLKDIDLICSNALEYNPDKNPGDRLIRHRACALRDTAYAIVREEMDEDFEQRCKEIQDSRKERGMFFDAKDLKACFSICNQECQAQFFALCSLLQGCSSSNYHVTPKQNSVPGCKKTEPKGNEKLKMPAAPVGSSTPRSNGKLHFSSDFSEKVLKSLFL
ncbi:ATAD2 protein, partial [Chunga burmeisteri]|nr:ATAD2 protein [Chunga burmeisteri]